MKDILKTLVIGAIGISGIFISLYKLRLQRTLSKMFIVVMENVIINILQSMELFTEQLEAKRVAMQSENQ